MKSNNSIVSNYLYNLMYQLLTLITPFITAPYTAKVFGAVGIGMESYVSSVTYYFSLFGALGIAVYGQREIARTQYNREIMSKTFWELFFLRMISTVFCICVYIFIIINMKHDQIYFLISSITLISGIFDISWFLMGIEMFKILVIRNSIIKIISIAILFIFIKKADQLILYMFISSATICISNLLLWPVVKKQLVSVKIRELNIKRHLKETLIYFIPTIATSIYTVLDKVMLGMLTSGTVENGYYEQANKIINMAKTVLLSLNTVMLPKLSGLYAQGKKENVRCAVLQSLKFAALIGIPLSFGLVGIADNFVTWFLGSEFGGTVSCIQIMAWLVIIIGVSNCLECQYITPIGRKRESNKIVITGAVINFFLNMLLIPRWGSKGAAIASVVAEIVITIMYLILCRQILALTELVKISYKKIFAACLMWGLIILLDFIVPNGIILTILQILFAIIFYFSVLLLIKDDFVIMVKNFVVTRLFRKKK